jgi:cyclic pyranopterin phosphate synthase
MSRIGEEMLDGYRRIIDYLRISVTDRCNFRCRYCMPSQGLQLLDSREILSYEELLRIIRVLGQYGISKIRITGGEPLLRRGIVDFLHSIRDIDTVKELSMTTNGSLLGKDNMSSRLKQAGLDRINISMDTTNPIRFAHITGQGQLQQVLTGMESALAVGIQSVKLNVVVTEALSDEDISYFVTQVYKHPLAIRFIECMPMGEKKIAQKVSISLVKNRIEFLGQGLLEPAMGIKGNGPAKYYRLPQAQGVFGFITPMTEHFCHSCNRIRLTADGKIKSCLLSNQEVDVKSLLRKGCADQKIYELFAKALEEKELQHSLCYHEKSSFVTRPMYRVGG